MIKLSSKWTEELINKPETGMGYQIVSIILKDGRKFDQSVVTEGQITEIHGYNDIPFMEEEISKIILTHEKWNFNAERSMKKKQ